MRKRLIALAFLLPGCASLTQAQHARTPVTFSVQRMGDGPIVGPGLHPSIGENIQGPSLIKAPDWLPGRLGEYYLYFADHKGAYIRLAYADALEGPWTIHPPGALQLAQTPFLQSPPDYSPQEMADYRRRLASLGVPPEVATRLEADALIPHIASPDVHVDETNRQIVMYYHGLEKFGDQVTRVAVSADGLNFASQPEALGRTYWRAFQREGFHYGLTMPGVFYRSASLFGPFEEGPTLFPPTMRHSAVFLAEDILYVVWSNVGADPPERLLLSAVDIRGEWTAWSVVSTVELMRPEREYEGAGLPLIASFRSVAPGPVNQLRDPAIYEENGRRFLLYSVAGESGIALAELLPSQPPPDR